MVKTEGPAVKTLRKSSKVTGSLNHQQAQPTPPPARGTGERESSMLICSPVVLQPSQAPSLLFLCCCCSCHGEAAWEGSELLNYRRQTALQMCVSDKQPSQAQQTLSVCVHGPMRKAPLSCLPPIVTTLMSFKIFS